AFSDPIRYRERIKKVSAFDKETVKLESSLAGHPQGPWLIEEMMLLREEYIISLFAQQEIKTLFPVSEKRIRSTFEEIGKAAGKYQT
ncbi:MAG: DUF3418 domain-containing protein, partial [Chitinivibrionales bacterium]|nr:DUF3418 domain-containing protein [Chitinivibrionales bacterium]